MRALSQRLASSLHARLRSALSHWHVLRFRCEASLNLAGASVGTNVRMLVPVHVAGGRGHLSIGRDSGFGFCLAPLHGSGAILIQPRAPQAEIAIGCATWISNNTSLVAHSRIQLGDRCLIGDLVQIMDCDFHDLNPASRHSGAGAVAPVKIGNNVWLGSRVLVLRGVEIGDNSVVGAGSVVTHSIPANTIAAGVPAKVLRTL